MKCANSLRRFETSSTSAIVLCLLMISGCSTGPVMPADLPPIPSSLTQLCAPLRPIVDGRQGEVVNQMIDDAEQYRLCANRQRALVEVVKFRETLYDVEKPK